MRRDLLILCQSSICKLTPVTFLFFYCYNILHLYLFYCNIYVNFFEDLMHVYSIFCSSSPPTPPRSTPTSPKFVFSVLFCFVLFIAHCFQFVMSIYSMVWGHPGACGEPTRGHSFKANQLSLPQNPLTVNSTSTRGKDS